jgi:hypothetical protein
VNFHLFEENINPQTHRRFVMRKLLALAVVVVFILAASPCWGEIPHLINYQGMLTDNLGEPLNSTYDLTFSLYNVSSDGTAIWTEAHSGVEVGSGLFNVVLGSETAGGIPSSVFDSDERYLGIKVGTDSELTPRVQLASVGYAYRAEKTDTANYAHASPLGPGDYTWKFRITDGNDTTITTGGGWGITRYGNTLYGNRDSTHINLGVVSTTGIDGQNNWFCTVGGGFKNNAREDYATVGGGYLNGADGEYSTVGGGRNSHAHDYAVVGGGWSNTALFLGTVGGGQDNAAIGNFCTVGGGLSNITNGFGATVPGGFADTAAGDYSLAAGYKVKITSDADYTFAFGRNFTTSTPNAVIFHNSVDQIKVGIGTTSPISAMHVSGSEATSHGKNSAIIISNTASGGADWYLRTGATGTVTPEGGFSIADGNGYRISIDNTGNVGIGTTDPTGKLDVKGDVIRIRTSQTPASSSADGYTGEIVWDASYIYICTSGDGPGGGTDTWKRAALNTW